MLSNRNLERLEEHQMMKNIKVYLIIVLSIFASYANAKDLTILFLGNSYTYLPDQGTPDDPALPKIIKQIAQSIDPSLDIKYSFNTPGGYTFEKHFNDSKSQALLRESFDRVILQGQSIESLELPPEWGQYGIGVQSFSIYLPKIVDLALKSNPKVFLFVNWGWNFKNSSLQPGAEGLLFPPGNPKAGKPWCGKDKFELQQMIDDSYRKHSRGLPVSLSMVGDAWLSLQQSGLVGEDDLYLPDDWSHPSLLGSYAQALILTRDVLNLDISKSTYIPTEVDTHLGRKIRDFLSK